MTDAGSIARHAAGRLEGALGSGLTIEVERELMADPLEPAERSGDMVSLASLVVSMASLGWTIWRDLKKDHATTARDEQVAALAAALGRSEPTRRAEPHRALLVQVVAEETVRAAG